MNCLIIFDQFIDFNRIDSFQISDEDKVTLFPLTSSTKNIEEMTAKINAEGTYTVGLIQTAELINETADKLRGKYIKFISDLSQFRLWNGQKLREYFSIDEITSSWWLSLVAEKNTLKTDSFQKLVQMDAICQIVERENVKKIYFACRSEKLKKTIGNFAKNKLIGFYILPVKDAPKIKESIRELQQYLYIKHVLHLIAFSFSFFIRAWRIKQKLGKLARKSQNENDIMIITYYPNIDVHSASKGLFKNRYYPGLQETIRAQGRDILWVCIYVENDSISFEKSLDYADQFIKRGVNIYFLEEFVSYLSILKSMLILLLIGIKFKMVENEIASLHAFEAYNFYDLFRDDWHSSFVGSSGFSGLMYYSSFIHLLRRKKTKKILYYCEMHAWEKALISAKNSMKNKIQLFAYQHATIPWMLLNYFNSPNETNDISRYSMPKPDMIICNGNLAHQYMRDCRWPKDKLTIAEAIRFDHLKAFLRLPMNKNRNVVLVVLSISAEWSSALLKMTLEALKDIGEIEVWVKPHPFLEMKAISYVSENVKMQSRIQVKTEPIEQLLSEAKAIIIGESSVALEALAFGCAVIIVDMPETVNMSPLRNVKAEMIKTVNSVSELEDTVIEIMNDNMPDRKDWPRKAKEIVDQFFYLDYESESPSKFIKILYNQSNNSTQETSSNNLER